MQRLADRTNMTEPQTSPISSPTATPSGDPPAPHHAQRPVPRWALHRRLYDWVLGFAHHRHSTAALATISFAESSFFPIPPDVLLAPLCMGNRRRAWWFALVTTVASVLGAVLGYYIGFGLWEATQQIWFDYIPGFNLEKFERVRGLYEQYGPWVLFVAAFTPIPFKVFTIAGGVMRQALPGFLLASIVGRGARFFLVAALFRWLGPKAQPWIDKYFNLLCIAFVLLLIAGFGAIKFLH